MRKAVEISRIVAGRKGMLSMDKRSHKGADGDGSGSYMQYIRLPAGQA